MGLAAFAVAREVEEDVDAAAAATAFVEADERWRLEERNVGSGDGDSLL